MIDLRKNREPKTRSDPKHGLGSRTLLQIRADHNDGGLLAIFYVFYYFLCHFFMFFVIFNILFAVLGPVFGLDGLI